MLLPDSDPCRNLGDLCIQSKPNKKSKPYTMEFNTTLPKAGTCHSTMTFSSVNAVMLVMFCVHWKRYNHYFSMILGISNYFSLLVNFFSFFHFFFSFMSTSVRDTTEDASCIHMSIGSY